jgi:hypothetical protein
VLRPWKGNIRSISSQRGIAASSVFRLAVGVSSVVVGIVSCAASALQRSKGCSLLGTDRSRLHHLSLPSHIHPEI